MINLSGKSIDLNKLNSAESLITFSERFFNSNEEKLMDDFKNILFFPASKRNYMSISSPFLTKLSLDIQKIEISIQTTIQTLYKEILETLEEQSIFSGKPSDKRALSVAVCSSQLSCIAQSLLISRTNRYAVLKNEYQ